MGFNSGLKGLKPVTVNYPHNKAKHAKAFKNSRPWQQMEVRNELHSPDTFTPSPIKGPKDSIRD
jgi:hypothetical protein